MLIEQPMPERKQSQRGQLWIAFGVFGKYAKLTHLTADPFNRI
jgi:hypothetical protein